MYNTYVGVIIMDSVVPLASLLNPPCSTWHYYVCATQQSHHTLIYSYAHQSAGSSRAPGGWSREASKTHQHQVIELFSAQLDINRDQRYNCVQFTPIILIFECVINPPNATHRTPAHPARVTAPRARQQRAACVDRAVVVRAAPRLSEFGVFLCTRRTRLPWHSSLL